MSWDFSDFLDTVSSAVELLCNGTSNFKKDESLSKRKKSKYVIEKVSVAFILISAVMLFFIFKDPLPTESYVQTLIVGSLIGLAISFIFFFIVYTLEKYYFKSVFQWLFFSCSAILFFVSVVLCVYFESGIFI